MGKRQTFPHAVLEKLDSYMQSNKTRTHCHTMHTNKLKIAKIRKH